MAGIETLAASVHDVPQVIVLRLEQLAELRQLGLLDGEADYRPAPIPARPDDRDDDAKRIAWAQRIWDATRDARGTPVAAYLAGRGITPSPRRLRCAGRRAAGTGRPARTCQRWWRSSSMSSGALSGCTEPI